MRVSCALGVQLEMNHPINNQGESRARMGPQPDHKGQFLIKLQYTTTVYQTWQKHQSTHNLQEESVKTNMKRSNLVVYPNIEIGLRL